MSDTVEKILNLDARQKELETELVATKGLVAPLFCLQA